LITQVSHPLYATKALKDRCQIVFLKEQNNMIDILNHYTLGFDQDRHIEGFLPGIKCRACLAPYKLSGYGAVAKARVNIFCFLKKLSNTCPAREGS